MTAGELREKYETAEDYEVRLVGWRAFCAAFPASLCAACPRPLPLGAARGCTELLVAVSGGKAAAPRALAANKPPASASNLTCAGRFM